MILTDANYEILTLLRSHRDDNKGISFMARHAYPIHSIRLYTPLEMSQLESALESADEKQNLRGEVLLYTRIPPSKWPRFISLRQPAVHCCMPWCHAIVQNW